MTKFAILVALFVAACSVCLVVACTSDDATESVGSSSAAVTPTELTYYDAGAVSPAHGATVSTLVSVPTGGSCTANGGQQIVSAWEQRGYYTDGLANAIYVGVVCSNSTAPMAITQVTKTLVGGNPPEWADASTNDMAWEGLPTLLSVGPPGWIALVALVGSATPAQDVTYATNIAIVLSRMAA
jgi:hypothetical protein